MIHKMSTLLKEAKFRKPDNDGDTRLVGKIESFNMSTFPVGLIIHRLILTNERNAIIGAGLTEQNEYIDPGSSNIHEFESDWFKASPLNNTNSVRINIYSQSLTMQRFELESIKLGDAAPGTYGYTSNKDILPGLKIISLTVIVGKPDYDGDTTIDVRLLIDNQTSHTIPRIALKCKSFTSNGRDIDDSNIEDELNISEIKYFETSFMAIKHTKAKGQIISPEIIVYDILDSTESITTLQVTDDIYYSEDNDDEDVEDHDDQDDTETNNDDDEGSDDLTEPNDESSQARHRIYIKTEPGGRVMFGELNNHLISKLIISLKNQKLDDDLADLRFNSSGILNECEGVFNSGEDGEFGNEGNIEFEISNVYEIPKDAQTGDFTDGVYYVHLSLSKVSIEFEFAPPDGEEFDCDKFSEISIPVRLPDCVQHPLYGDVNFNVVTDYKYNGEFIPEYDHDLCDRGYEDQITIIVVRDGNPSVVYQSYNGDEEWGDADLLISSNSAPQTQANSISQSSKIHKGITLVWYGLPDSQEIIEGFEFGAYKLNSPQVDRFNLKQFNQLHPPINLNPSLMELIDNNQDWINHTEIEKGFLPCTHQIRTLAEWSVTGPSYGIRDYSINVLKPLGKITRLNYSSLLDQLIDDESSFDDNTYYLVWRTPKKYPALKGEIHGSCEIENVMLNVFSVPKIGSLITGITYDNVELNKGEWEAECFNGTKDDEWFIVSGGKVPKIFGIN